MNLCQHRVTSAFAARIQKPGSCNIARVSIKISKFPRQEPHSGILEKTHEYVPLHTIENCSACVNVHNSRSDQKVKVWSVINNDDEIWV